MRNALPSFKLGLSNKGIDMKALRMIFVLLLSVSPAFANPNKITNDIDEALNKMAYSGRHDFDVEVKSGVVTFEGFVSSTEDRNKVEKIALAIDGVKKVVNRLNVLGGSVVSSSPVAKTIRDRIKADPSIKNYTLNISHKENNILLTGNVIAQADKEKIFSIAYSVAPNTNIQNNLRVITKLSVPDSEINEKVLAALKTEGVSGVDTVVVDTQAGVVKFSGQVKNHRDIDKMLSLALMVEGVQSVRSEVQIGK